MVRSQPAPSGPAAIPPATGRADPEPRGAAIQKLLDRATALREQAVAANHAGRPDRAARLVRSALTVLDGSPVTGRPEIEELRVNCLITWALADFLASGLQPAQARLAQAALVIDALPGPLATRLRARWHFQRGAILGRTGQLDAALADLAVAAVNLAAFSPRERPAVTLLRGMLQLEIGAAGEAARAFGLAAEQAKALGDEGTELSARHNEALACYRAGDLPQALDLLERSEGAAHYLSEALVLLDRAHVLLEAGLVHEAETDLLRASELTAGGDVSWWHAAEIAMELARAARLLGRLDEASESVTRAVGTFRRRGAAPWAARAELLRLQIDRDRGSTAKALVGRARQVGAVAVDCGDTALADRARVVAAEVLALGGDWEGARGELGTDAGDGAVTIQGRLQRAYVEALVRRGEGDLRGTRQVLSGAARTLDHASRGMASLDLRTARALHAVRLADLDLDLAIAQGAPAALASLERWRAATERLPTLRPPADAALAGLTEQLRTVHAHIREEEDPSVLADLRRRATGLQRRIRSHDWTLSRQGPAPAKEALRKELARARLAAHDRDLIWFASHRGRLIGVGIIDGRARVRDLMPIGEATELAARLRADLTMAASHELGPLQAAVWSSLRSVTEDLDRAAIRPWGSRRQGMVVIPCNELSALPWSLLPSLAGRPVTVARTLSGWSRRAGSGPVGRTRVHVSAGPRLEWAAEEATAVAECWRPTATVDVAEHSSAGAFVAAVTAYDVVHVAAHGTHQAQSPLFSRVELDDGPAYAHELQPRGVTAGHVVLSACEVGSSTIRPGDEALGFAASLWSLGAASIVGPVTPIPDGVSAAVMSRYHRHLAAGEPTDAALALAIAASDPVSASFIAMGSTWRRGDGVDGGR